MARHNITEKIWYDPAIKSSIMLDVTEDIPAQKPMTIDGVELLPKDEYHSTLVPAGKLSDDPEEIRRILEEVTGYLTYNPNAIQFAGLTNNYFVCRDGEEMTVIVEAELVGLNGLRKVVQQVIPDYRPVFPHVTLLKNAASAYGIGVNSRADLRKYCKRITL